MVVHTCPFIVKVAMPKKNFPEFGSVEIAETAETGNIMCLAFLRYLQFHAAFEVCMVDFVLAASPGNMCVICMQMNSDNVIDQKILVVIHS